MTVMQGVRPRQAGDWVRRMRAARLRLAPLIAALGIAGCAQAAPPASLTADDVATLQRADRIITTELSPEEHALIVNAHGALVEDCMQALGWDFEVGTASAVTESGGAGSMSQLEQWTFADVPSAETNGYGLEAYLAEHAEFIEQMEGGSQGRIPDPETMSPEEAARFELDYFGTEEEQIVIVERDGSRAGQPGGGCIGDASRAVYGDIAEEMRLRDARGTAESEIWLAALEEGAVNDALNAWKACVREQGFEFEDPHQAHDVALSAAQAEDFDREREIATTDASCKAETGLARAVEAAFVAATNEVLPELESDLIALQQFEADALERAKEILQVGEN